MSDERHFSNPYPKFSERSSQDVFEPNSTKLCIDFKKKVGDNVLKLQQIMEENIDEELDWKDVSVYTGVSGYIYLYIHLADALQEERYLQKGVKLAKDVLRKLKGRRETFLCGDAGPLALCAVIYNKLGYLDELKSCIERLKKLKHNSLDKESGLPDEMLYGRTGYLFALLYVQRNVEDHGIEDDLIRRIITEVLDSGKRLSLKEKSKSPLLYQWHEKFYLGAAHGMAGILFMLLQVRDHLTPQELNELVKPSIDWMMSLGFSSGNLPSSLGNNSDRLIHWCHGAPGAIFMFLLANKVFEDAKYLDQAKKCADVIWSRGLLRKGDGLCHGTSGNAYALLYTYQMTGEVSYLYKAAQFANWCFGYRTRGCRKPDRPFSLFEGLAGTIYFLADIVNPDKSKFPGFVL